MTLAPAGSGSATLAATTITSAPRAAAVRAIRSGYLKRRQDGQPDPAITYLAAGLRLLIDAVALNLVFPGGR